MAFMKVTHSSEVTLSRKRRHMLLIPPIFQAIAAVSASKKNKKNRSKGSGSSKAERTNSAAQKGKVRQAAACSAGATA